MKRSKSLVQLLALMFGVSTAVAAEIDDRQGQIVRDAERARIEAMVRAAPSVVCIFEHFFVGGGSGVLITPDGYGLTNFHVIAPMLESREAAGGLASGKLYLMKILGIDPTGDVAMFRLLGPAAATQPSTPPFEPAVMSDSDTVAVGDWVFAMGNPFLLAEDYTPTVTHGIVSGIHRYQFGGDTRSLAYTDCIQVDASINPGNSGGPLFDMQGRLIGINGRASFEQRGRVNVGLGYAITINQIQRFIPGLRAGLLTEHGSLGATTIDLGYRRVVFEKMLDPSPAASAGIQVGDRLLEFAGREIHSSNQFANILGVFPANWPVEVIFEHEGKPVSRVIRLEPIRVDARLPFTPDPAINRAEAQRVLGECRAVLGTNPINRDLLWYASRTAGADGPLRNLTKTNLVRVIETSGGQGECRLFRMFDETRQAVQTFEYNGRTAQTRISDKQAADASAEETACLNLWLAARRAVYNPDDGALWRHLGGDGYMDRVVDLLEYTAATGQSIRIAIDPVTHFPVRAMWKPTKSGNRFGLAIEMELDDYREESGLQLPHEFRVFAGGAPAFVDRIRAYGQDQKP